jgi:hypothetical protein
VKISRLAILKFAEVLFGKRATSLADACTEFAKRRLWQKALGLYLLLNVHIFFNIVSLGLWSKFIMPDSLKTFQLPPGQKLYELADFLFSKQTNERVFFPVVADMREEYFEALSQNRIWKARWVHVRGTWSFVAAMGLDRFFSVVSLCVKVWKSVN